MGAPSFPLASFAISENSEPFPLGELHQKPLCSCVYQASKWTSYWHEEHVCGPLWAAPLRICGAQGRVPLSLERRVQSKSVPEALHMSQQFPIALFLLPVSHSGSLELSVSLSVETSPGQEIPH